MTDRLHAPKAVGWIVRTLEEAGFESWAVGGAVRDALLGVDSADWDLATRATPKQLRKLFRRTVPIGIDHGTVGVLARDGTMYEVTTFRRDVETFGRHAVVAFAESIEEDLSRRDFTINAIAWHPIREVLLDPFDGAGDLERRLVRTVGPAEERFAEDWLRILRAFRFAGRLDFEIDPATRAAAVEAVEHLRELSVERVQEELWKILTGPGDPSRALELWERSGAVEVLIPEVLDRGEDDADLAAARTAVDRLPRHRPLLRWVAWIRDGGLHAPLEGVEGGRHADERTARATAAAVGLMTRLRFSNAKTRDAAELIAAGRTVPGVHQVGRAGSEPDDEARRRWLARVGPARLPDLIRLAGAEADGADDRRRVAWAARELRRVARSGAPLSVGELALSGRDLIRAGHRPGPHFGRVLDHLLDRVLRDPSMNEADRLMEIAEARIAEEAEVDGRGGRPPNERGGRDS